MTNSTTVAMTSNGSVRYEMPLLFNLCHRENPASGCGATCEFVELEFFINVRCKSWRSPIAMRVTTRSFNHGTLTLIGVSIRRSFSSQADLCSLRASVPMPDKAGPADLIRQEGFS